LIGASTRLEGIMRARDEPSGDVIAFCGTRGVPAKYGGFETAVDEISRRLVEWGYDCEIFCRASSGEKALARHEGRYLTYVGGSSRRSLDTFVSALQTGWHLLRNRRRYRHVFWFNNANLPGILLTLLARIPTSVNVDGLEWRRAKWTWPYKAYYLVATFLISRLCDTLISDSKAIRSYYEKNLRKGSGLVPYGAPQAPRVPRQRHRAILERYGVAPKRYLLQITRLEPDNLPLEGARAFRAAGLAREGFALLIVGYQHENPYTRQLKDMSGADGILVAPAIYDPETLAVLRENCFCYVHGNSVGGTNPALLEAMSACPRVLAIEGPFSREVLGETGYYFSPDAMDVALSGIPTLPARSEAMRDRVRSRYRWDAVAESYARLALGRPAAYWPMATDA
jgi:glycosyltransferase involved in cell wall biosynthesis